MIMQSQPAFFKNCMNCSKSRKASYARYWSKQCALEVSVIATEMVSSTILLPTKKNKEKHQSERPSSIFLNVFMPMRSF